MTRTHRILIGVVVTGAVIIAGIGFAGSYAAVRQLALDKGFGWFANVFPIGVDAGIVVLLSLDLLLTWLRIPFPLLRQTAWLLTAATIAFNGAAAWPDPLGVGMHAIIPVLFVVSVEAARHAIGRIADITADKHMEGVRFTRWLLAPLPTFKLWRRMKLWELRSYEEVIRREQDRLVYRARLRARYGVAWRRRAPIEAIMPLRLAKYGVPLAETAEAGLEAAGIEVLSPVRQLDAGGQLAADPAAGAGVGVAADGAGADGTQQAQAQPQAHAQALAPGQQPAGRPSSSPSYEEYHQEYAQGHQEYDEAAAAPAQQWQGAPHDSPWFAAQQYAAQERQREEEELYAQQQMQQQAQAQGQGQAPVSLAQQEQQLRQQAYEQQQAQAAYEQQQAQAAQAAAEAAASQIRVPAGPNRTRPLGGAPLAPLNGNGSSSNGNSGGNGHSNGFAGGSAPQNGRNGRTIPAPRAEEIPEPEPEPLPDPADPAPGLDLPDGIPMDEAFFAAYRQYVRNQGSFPNARQFARYLPEIYGGTAPEERDMAPWIRDMRYRFQSESDTEHIP
ncbi:DUF2637 domain-containing protein [Streptomyces sp. CA-111067]|uniref:DUF2637 domain-containing protein n=1 Tax=Streptomyces sp. CA-111067 TaxID=3240046 RepID=UPI003D99CAF8